MTADEIEAEEFANLIQDAQHSIDQAIRQVSRIGHDHVSLRLLRPAAPLVRA